MRTCKRILGIMLSLAVILTMMPNLTLSINAETQYRVQVRIDSHIDHVRVNGVDCYSGDVVLVAAGEEVLAKVFADEPNNYSYTMTLVGSDNPVVDEGENRHVFIMPAKSVTLNVTSTAINLGNLTGSVSISGNLTSGGQLNAGAVLHANVASNANIIYYQWYRDGAAISGADGETYGSGSYSYTTTSHDVGHTITCIVTAPGMPGQLSSNGIVVIASAENTLTFNISGSGKFKFRDHMYDSTTSFSADAGSDILFYMQSGAKYTINATDSTGATVAVSNRGTRGKTLVMPGADVTVDIAFDQNWDTDLSHAIVKLSATSYPYDGNVHRPNVTSVKLNGVEVDASTRRIVYENTNSVRPGTYKVTVEPMSNELIALTGKAVATYRIEGDVIDGATVTGITNKAYTGSAITQNITVVLNGRTLVQGTDYSVKYTNNVKPGTATVRIEGLGSLGGAITKTFEITCSHSRYTDSTKVDKYATTGSDGHVTYSRVCSACGTSLPISVTEKVIPKVSEISLNSREFAYTGSTITPVLTVRDRTGADLRRGTDYIVEGPTGAKAPGSYTLEISGTGNYMFYTEITYVIEDEDDGPGSGEPGDGPGSGEPGDGPGSGESTKISITEASIDGVDDAAYTGSEITCDVVVTIGDEILEEGVDYEVSYQDNVQPGTAVVVITGIGNYYGVTREHFDIICNHDKGVSENSYYRKATTSKDGEVGIKRICDICDEDISEDEDIRIIPKVSTVKLDKESYAYTGNDITPNVIVKDRTGAVLRLGVDYKLTGTKSATAKGSYAVNVMGLGDYDIAEKLYWSIAGDSLESGTITGISDAKYTGSEITCNITINVSGRTLVEGVDYKVTYSNNIKPGVATVTITGRGAYTGTCTKHFHIRCMHDHGAKEGSILKTKATMSADGTRLKSIVCAVCGEGLENSNEEIKIPRVASVSTQATYTFTTNGITPVITVKDSKGSILKKDVDYTISGAVKATNVGTYTITAKGKGDYSFEKTVAYVINPPKTSITSLTKGSKRFKAKWTKKTLQVTGYQLQYSTKKSFSSGVKSVKITSYKTYSRTVKKLKGKKKYYVRIRTYRKVGTKTYYSGWSTTKSVTTKK